MFQVQSRGHILIVQIKELTTTCREYIIGLTLETERRKLVTEQPDNIGRNLELAAYFTHCKLQPTHVQLALRSAMGVFSRAGNHATAAVFARRLIDSNPSDSKVVTQVCVTFLCSNCIIAQTLTCRPEQSYPRATAIPEMPSKSHTTTLPPSISAQLPSRPYTKAHPRLSLHTRERGTCQSTRAQCVRLMR